VKAFGQALRLVQRLLQTTGQLLTLGIGQFPQRPLPQSSSRAACGGTEDLQVAQQVVAWAGFDQHRGDLHLPVAFQKNQGSLEQALARHPVAGLVSAIENAQIRAGQAGGADRFHQFQTSLSVGARQGHQILGGSVSDDLSPLHPLLNPLRWLNFTQLQCTQCQQAFERALVSASNRFPFWVYQSPCFIPGRDGLSAKAQGMSFASCLTAGGGAAWNLLARCITALRLISWLSRGESPNWFVHFR